MMVKRKCEICGTEYIDYSVNQAKRTCSNKCRRLLYDGSDSDKRFNRLVALRITVFRLKGMDITKEEVSIIKDKLKKGVCEICGKECETKNLCIDHCHKTNKVRGVICSRCNYALGFANDDPEMLLKFIEYLK